MAAEGSVETGRLMTFRVGPGRFALLLDDVLGVQDPVETGASSGAAVIFQGRPVAAADARVLWWGGAAAPPVSTAPALIIVGSGGETRALIVDRVEGIVEGVAMLPLPPLVETFVKNVFRGVTLHADGERLVVDPAALSGRWLCRVKGGLERHDTQNIAG